MAEKIPHVEDRCAHVKQPRSGVSAQLVAGFCSVLNPLRDPFRMPAINGMVAFGPICAWNKIAVGAQWLKAQDLLKNVRGDRHPPLTSFWKKILLGAINDANTSVADPMRAGIYDFDIAEPQTRKQ